MSRRKYTHVQELEEEILSMRQKGATRQEIADQLGLSKSQIKSWINRYNRKQAKLKSRNFSTTERQAEEKRMRPETLLQSRLMKLGVLRMENELLRDFLRSTERK